MAETLIHNHHLIGNAIAHFDGNDADKVMFGRCSLY